MTLTVRDADLLDRVPLAWARRHLVLPVGRTTTHVEVAVGDMGALEALDDLAFSLQAPIRALAVDPATLTPAIVDAYAGGQARIASAANAIDAADLSTLRDQLASRPDLLDTDDDAPIIRLVDALISEAVRVGASDLHIEPTEDSADVRIRVDGLLRTLLAPARRHLPAIVARIKILARLDVAERRLPQDGRFGVQVGGHPIDIRVSVVPTAFGERAVLRLLDHRPVLDDFAGLGFDQPSIERLERLLALPHGIILLTGPTGSGKTTTLYAALRRLATGERNILTIEDPVEYELAGVGQMQVNPRIGLDFATGLRALLRQDPDVILVGEIRDEETAKIALQAALTGHLVFATLHTNDAATAPTRLLEMGAEPYLIASTVRAVVAQRLVRRICQACTGDGCPRCAQTGLSGRIVIHELIESSPALRAAIIERTDAAGIGRVATAAGMVDLRARANELVGTGITTRAEVERVLAEAV